MKTEWRECGLCGEERPVERPECLDGHGEDCPEAFCALCGHAIWAAMTLSDHALTRMASSQGA